MALKYCTECGHKVSDKAKCCPKCGFKVKKKRGNGCTIAIFIVVIILYFFYYIGTTGDNKSIIDVENINSLSWRTPYGSEYGDIGKIIIANKIRVCGEYHLKEVNIGEYIIACTADGTNWKYYVVYTELDKIYSENDEMTRELTPPR